MVESNGSEALVQSILEGDELRRRHGSLRWGIVLVALAAGFAIVQGSGWTEPNAGAFAVLLGAVGLGNLEYRSEEHTSELQSLMRSSYAVFCLKKKKNKKRSER